MDNMQLPARDVRLLELLVKKHEKLYEEQHQSQQAHRAWLLQKERDTKAAASEWTAWRSQVNEKRRRENEENLRRWRRLEEVFRQSQENLASLISGKEERAREMLTLQRQARARRVEERRSAEDARKAAQEAALRVREEAEEHKRQHLIHLWEQQQRLVEQRRREREDFFRRRVVDGNLAETEQQEERQRQVEERGEVLLAAMRNSMEERLARAEANLRLLNEAREDTLTRQRGERERRGAAVRALHNQLEASMMQWRQHILSRQLESMEAAEARQEQYLRSRANRIYADRSSRHVHHHHLLQQVLAREEAELAMVRRCLDAKDTRSHELARERERQVTRARCTAHTTAALRDNLKKKLAPETFDKVVARANLELRIENRPPATSSMGTRSHIFLGKCSMVLGTKHGTQAQRTQEPHRASTHSYSYRQVFSSFLHCTGCSNHNALTSPNRSTTHPLTKHLYKYSVMSIQQHFAHVKIRQPSLSECRHVPQGNDLTHNSARITKPLKAFCSNALPNAGGLLSLNISTIPVLHHRKTMPSNAIIEKS
ncbi:hypothetical protein GWK47_023618 [Chionoecetes opilio]|uniref:Uncharacterized protein n=1 Tax=Chionoecetes opilio TaxID=41210 RepID=A0A8J4XLN1_CHIOP|nr:hypothetical protein GWK47_023618 [Chionoecetes opilio]